MLSADLDTIRITLHLLGVTVWIGGQILMAALVPVLRGISSDAPRLAAARFGQVAWAFFGLAMVTGIWNIFALEGTQSSEYNATLGVKLLAVTVSGMAAFLHQRTPSAAVRGATGGIGLIAALAALLLGVML